MIETKKMRRIIDLCVRCFVAMAYVPCNENLDDADQRYIELRAFCAKVRACKTNDELSQLLEKMLMEEYKDLIPLIVESRKMCGNPLVEARHHDEAIAHTFLHVANLI